ncbi:FG-GAP-like repeat-containing protein [Chryseolinea sp. H1M3-3]|uniref:FG-GAP-like repeat-containing protein n=1 Tax=Chryseolinea sp. H1M3-3 TaxID=3034144 RepID=UPI0023EB43F9|nr:FG-GAP-like repeat-containing protein [Chryseolinea sp. H1M3-3]
MHMRLAINHFIQGFRLCVLAILFVAPAIVLAADVTGTSPGANAQQVAISSNITVTFDAAISAAVVTTANFKVNGAQSGAIFGTLTGGNTNTITFNPTGDFKAGEVVTVTLTPGLGLALGYAWQFTVASSSNTPAFVTIPSLSTTATTAHAIYPADLNGDADVDILSAAPQVNLVNWYENDGSPVLTANKITPSAAVDIPVSLHAGDLDNDGDTDVVVASHGNSRIVWFENNGAAEFTPRTLESGEQVRSLHMADIDSDGDMDVIAACQSFNKILVYENNGAQVFTPRTVVTGLSMPNTVYAADVDGDHDIDIVASSYNNSTFSENKISWFENQQSSGFVTHNISTAVTYPYSVYATDMDRDGDMDVLSVSSSSGEMFWHENNGSQVFTNRKIIASGANAESVYAADIDGDGDMDVLTATLGTKKVWWYENNGAQVFTQRAVSTGADGVMSIYAADVDSDGDMDIMTASLNDHRVAWYPNNMPPVIAGAVANQNTNDYSTIALFSTITVSDRDAGQKLAISVQLDLAAKGNFTAASLTASGFINAGSGKYTFTGTAAAAQAALRLLVFAPTTGRMPVGNNETVQFTITANDAISPAATNNITTVIVTAASSPAANVAPSFTKGPDIEVNEDASAQTPIAWAKDISAGPASESGQILNFLLSNDNNTLFTSQPVIDALGTLSFQPSANSSGTATVTVVLKDNGGTANGGVDQSIATTFVITVNPVNDAPSFTKTSDIEANEDALAQTFVAWAKDISAGPASESGQILNFLLSNDNNTLFISQPAIDALGTLTFQSAANANGTATVTVVLKDNGGTANGGVDQSIAATFVITINPVNDAPLIDPLNNVSIVAGNTPATITLTGLHPGPGENSQKLTITPSSGTPSLLDNPSATLNDNGTATLVIVPTPGNLGIVTITVVVQDDGGTDQDGDDETTISFNVSIVESDNQPDPDPSSQTVFLPTLFSPNGDGANDVFRLRATGIADVRFCLYSADGHEVFRTTDITEATETGWNGKYHGRDMPTGTYTWTLHGHFNDGSPLTIGSQAYGQVLLLR